MSRNIVPPISTYPQAERRQLYRKLSRIVTGEEGPLPVTFEEMRERLHLFQQSYGGVQPIPVDKVVGSAARSKDFDEDFLPMKPHLKQRWESLERAYPTGDFPPIDVYQVGDVYFVIDGHHRVGLAKHMGVDQIDAEVTVIHTDLDIHDALTFRELIQLEMRRWFMRESGLAATFPDAEISFTRPEGWAELLEHVRLHGYHMMMARATVVPIEEIAADWYRRTFLPTIEAIREERLSELTPRESTDADLFLWVHQKRRAMFTSHGLADYPEVVRATADAEEETVDLPRGGVLRRARRLIGRLRRS